MNDDSSQPPATFAMDAESTPTTDAVAEDPSAFFMALPIAGILLIILDSLLGSLMWLPFFSGLLGFFVEGLIAGGIAFRVARAARPVGRFRLWSGIVVLVVVGMAGLLFFEYWHFCGRVGRPPNFSRSRNIVLKEDADPAARRAALDKVGSEAIDAFAAYLKKDYPPGGPIGYAIWATKSGVARLKVRDETQTIEAGHRGMVWPIRTAIGAILLALGLAMSFDALKSPSPVRNVLLPGEEYEELED